MALNRLLLLIIFFCSIILIAVNSHRSASKTENKIKDKETAYDDPEQFLIFHEGIRTREGEDKPAYRPAYLIDELRKAKFAAQARRSTARQQSNGVLEWKERGPSNVPGRTRGLIVDPDDPSKNTWFAGSAGGGVWKTTTAGQSWIHLTPDLPNLATTVLAMAESDHNIIYLGTGEGFGNSDGIAGNGIFKSIDKGQTWNHLSSTPEFGNINRVVVSPVNPDVAVAGSNNGIYRTTDGGINWTNVLDESFIQDLRATPGNFNVQYAAQNGLGVYKSIDGGQTWLLSNIGMQPSGRVEIAVSPVNTNRIFASAEGGLTGSELYMSDDAGNSWNAVNVSFNNARIDFLDGQGWYDNTLACDPFNSNIVYLGGVGLFRTTLTSGSTLINNFTLEEDETSFLSLINFGGNFGELDAGPFADASVEVRFGPGKTQKAHRFLVPEGATSGVPDANYTFQDYVDVPFEVWEVDVNGNDVKQLMVSFRDQDRNGVFNLKLFDTSSSAVDQSREYIFISNQDYSTAAHPSIAVNGGQVFNDMYFFWPVLATGIWDPLGLPDSELRITLTSIPLLNAETTTVADVYSQYDGKNNFGTFGIDVHPDQHNIVMIPVTASTYKILIANDGGLFISNTSTTPGINEGDWTMAGISYNTSQFYGADKRPGKEEYFGGMQDNGTWKSPINQNASSTINYLFTIGGDGFEVLWHNLDDQKLIGGSQFNAFRRSLNGGGSWTDATTGLTGDAPFISKLANSKSNPDVIFTVTSSGVFRSDNFGQVWSLTPITDKWGASTFLDVEVSRANANIVWAGSGMTDGRNLHVSTDGGLTFNVTNNFALIPNFGRITRLASHPDEDNTAYAVFSFSNSPKVLRTTDLGQTWEDISGFELSDESNNGFPDVAVYCLYVRPDNPDIIWAGTEIGIVESLDNGLSWALLDDFPNVSVWDMKGQDDQVVIATHGRGIWSATIEASQHSFVSPEITAFGTAPDEDLKLRLKIEENFDSIQVFSGTDKLGVLPAMLPSEVVVSISDFAPGSKQIKMIAYSGNAPVHSKVYGITHLDILTVEDSYSSYFSSVNDLTLTGMFLQSMPGALSSERRNLQTHHPYTNNFEYSMLIRHPIRVNDNVPLLYYGDIAIIEPDNDYALVEASTNGLDWTPLAPEYDANANAAWLDAYNSGNPGNKSTLINHEIDLSETFNAGDSVLIRFRLKSNTTLNGWGWAIDYVSIQQEPTEIETASSAQGKFTLFPNPATDLVNIDFELKRPSAVEIILLDLTGKILSRLKTGQKQIGKHVHSFDVSTRSAGIYTVMLKTSEGSQSRRLIINN